MSMEEEFEAAFEASDIEKMRALVTAGMMPKPSYLTLAAYRGKVERLTALIELGLAPTGGTLAKAASEGNLKAMDAIVAAGVDVNTPMDDGKSTALHYAAAEKKLDAVEWLLARGANLEQRSASGRTPLQIAVSQKAKAVAGRLVEAGAKVGPDEAKVLRKWNIEVRGVDASVQAPRNPDHVVVSFAELEATLHRLYRPTSDGALGAATLVRLDGTPALARVKSLIDLVGAHPSLRWSSARGECAHLEHAGHYAVLRLLLAHDSNPDESDEVYAVTCRTSNGWALALLQGEPDVVATFLGIRALPVGPAWRVHEEVAVGRP